MRRGSYLLIGAEGLVGRLLAELIHHIRPKVIVLAAADAYVERCERDPEPTRRVNVDASRRIGEVSPTEHSPLKSPNASA